MRVRITRHWRPAGFPEAQLEPGATFNVSAALAKYLLALAVAEPVSPEPTDLPTPATAEPRWSLLWRLTKGDSRAVAIMFSSRETRTLHVAIDRTTVFSCAFPLDGAAPQIDALAVTARRELEARGWTDTVESTPFSLSERFRELHATALRQLARRNYHALDSLLRMERQVIDELHRTFRLPRSAFGS